MFTFHISYIPYVASLCAPGSDVGLDGAFLSSMFVTDTEIALEPTTSGTAIHEQHKPLIA